MSKLINKIKSKYSLRNIFDYANLDKTIRIIKYNKKIMKDLDYSMKDIKYFLV